MELRYKLDEITQIAQQLIYRIQKHNVILFEGALAAGKTTLIQEIVRSLGYQGAVRSPTFVLERRYPVDKPPFQEVVHIDLYRLNHREARTAIDWGELLESEDRLILVEWPDRYSDKWPPRTKIIKLEILTKDERKLTFDSFY